MDIFINQQCIDAIIFIKKDPQCLALFVKTYSIHRRNMENIESVRKLMSIKEQIKVTANSVY
jgi:hypothetical protein